MNPNKIKRVDSPYNLKERLYFNYSDQEFVDTVIRASNGTIKAHGLILSGNPVFKNLLVSGNTINLPQFSKEVLKVIIEFLYRGDSRYYQEIEEGVLKAKEYFFGVQTPNLEPNDYIEQSALFDQSQMLLRSESDIWITPDTQLGQNVVTSTQMPEDLDETVCISQETCINKTIRQKKRNRENEDSRTDLNKGPGTSKDLAPEQPAVTCEQPENAVTGSSDGSFVFDLPHEQLTSPPRELRVNLEAINLKNSFELTEDDLSGEIVKYGDLQFVISDDDNSKDEMVPKRKKICQIESSDEEDVCDSVIPQREPELNPGQKANLPDPNPGEETSVADPNPGEGTSVPGPNTGEGISVQEPNPGEGMSVPEPNPGRWIRVRNFSVKESRVKDVQQWSEKNPVSKKDQTELESRIEFKPLKENVDVCVVCMKKLQKDCIDKTHNLTIEKNSYRKCKKCKEKVFYSKFFLKEHEKICGT